MKGSIQQRLFRSGRRPRRPSEMDRNRLVWPLRSAATTPLLSIFHFFNVGAPSPFSNVFKWQFENTTIIHFSFFIFHFAPSAYGGCGWGMAGRLPALQAGAGGVWPADCRRYRPVRAGYGRQIAGATGVCGARGVETPPPTAEQCPEFVISSAARNPRPPSPDP